MTTVKFKTLEGKEQTLHGYDNLTLDVDSHVYKERDEKNPHTSYEYKISITKIANSVDSKDGLIHWASKMASEAYYSQDYLQFCSAGSTPRTRAEKIKYVAQAHIRARNESAKLGTEIHAQIEAFCKDIMGGTLQENDLHNGLRSFIRDELIPIAVEMPVMHPLLIPGCVDLVCKLRTKPNDGFWIVDWKTKKSSQIGEVYKQNFLQLSAYKKALEEKGNQIDGVMIVQVARDSSDFKVFRYLSEDLEEAHEAFCYAVRLYNYRKPKTIEQRDNRNEKETEEASPWVSKVLN